ncbi:AEC family transporter [Candidatus Woesearchaeota archaeon]|nr:AEC family transporter [Candidatus Woesearchaeota archaeon]
MASIPLVVGTIVPVFLLIFLGWVIGLRRKDDIKSIIDFIVYFTAPALIFNSLASSDIDLSAFSSVALAAIAIIAVQGSIAYFMFRNNKGMTLPATIGNTGYLGYPLALFAFGSEGLSMAIAYDVIGSLFLFSLGVYIVHHKNNLTEMFRMPYIYAIFLGLLVNITGIIIPEPMLKAAEMLGSITIPAALIVLGIVLSRLRIDSYALPSLASFFKIFAGFFLAFVITNMLGLTGTEKSVILLQASMPSAVMSMVLTQKYKKDADLAASTVLISTVLGMVIIPILILFLS